VADCPSTVHEGAPVRAVAPGRFTNPWNRSIDVDVVYCADCAYWMRWYGFFTPTVRTGRLMRFGHHHDDFTPTRRPTHFQRP
jgi:hypothetical protein